MQTFLGFLTKFFTNFFRTTLTLWGFFVPATMLQFYLNGRASVSDVNFIYPSAIACLFVAIGAAILAFLNALSPK